MGCRLRALGGPPQPECGGLEGPPRCVAQSPGWYQNSCRGVFTGHTMISLVELTLVQMAYTKGLFCSCNTAQKRALQQGFLGFPLWVGKCQLHINFCLPFFLSAIAQCEYCSIDQPRWSSLDRSASLHEFYRSW